MPGRSDRSRMAWEWRISASCAAVAVTKVPFIVCVDEDASSFGAVEVPWSTCFVVNGITM
jgi:hypothetical protein